MSRKKMKLFVCALLAFVMILPNSALLSAQTNGGHWAAKTLNKWEEQGLLLPDFEPNEQLTRLGFITLINHVLGLKAQSERTFTDVDPQSEQAAIVNIAATAGYIQGYGDGSFRADKPISREEAAVILTRVFSVKNPESTTSFKDDASLKSWSKAAVHGLVAEGYVNGYPDGSFKPEKGVSFAELITMLDNIVDVIISKPGEYSDISARNILITAPNVIVKNSKIQRNVYVSAGAADGGIEIQGSTVGKEIISTIEEADIKLTDVTVGEGTTPAPSATPSPTPGPTAGSGGSTGTTPGTPTPAPTIIPQFTEVSVHDPSIVKENNKYYVFGSHGDAAASDDLLNWQAIGNGYTKVNNKLYGDLEQNLKESFKWAGHNDSDSLGGFAVWAPDVQWVAEFDNGDGTQGAYLLYYSVSSTYIRSAIGVAASKTIEGPYQYVETIIYSGFTNVHAQDKDSQIDKYWENTNIAALKNEEVLADVRSGWFKEDGSYNNAMFPNAIDANLFRDADNKLWMSYGSWSGGIFVLEIDPATGLPKYPGQDGTTEDGRMIDRYFGTKISGGYTKSGEGPYVIYDPETEYFYLFVTYGWLGIDGEYNMRVFRSQSPTGPFLDASGQNAVLPNGVANDAYGNKLMGHYSFDRYVGEQGSGDGIQYVSPGHNSVLIDEDGKRFVVFHTRFSQTVDGHQLRVHQLIVNEDGWLVATPYRYSGETLGKVTDSEIAGEYRFINHEKDSSKTVHHSDYIQLESNGTVSGAVTGTWQLTNDYTATITIGDQQYKGAFLYQWDSASQARVMVFAAMNSEGKTIWGSKLDVTISIAQDILNDLSLGDTSSVAHDLSLPAVATRNIAINWTSSNDTIVTDNGKIFRPSSAESPATATLTASFEVNGQVYTKPFEITLKPVPAATLKAQYSFEGDLADALDENKVGTVVGDKINVSTTKQVSYANHGIVNQALYLDGTTGIVLPNDLIDSYNYSVAMWLSPDQLTNFTTAFFGAADGENWISMLPSGNAVATTQLWHRDGKGNRWLDASGKGKLATEDWTHFTMTVEEGLASIYINGELTYRGAGIADLFSDGDSVFSLAVNYWDIPYKGYVDELTIYDGVLTEAEVAEFINIPIAVNRIKLPSTNKVMSVGQSYTPRSVTVLPSLVTDPSIQWSSSNEQVATVDAATGVVTAVSTGTTTITATSVSTPSISNSYTLHVVAGAIAYYDFENSLENKAIDGQEAAAYSGNLIASNTSDQPQFASFNDGQAEHTGLVLDGSHGVILPNHYFNDSSYTVSLRVKMDRLQQFSTLFFAQDPSGSWISLLPGGLDDLGNKLMLWSNYSNQWFNGVTEQAMTVDKWTTITLAADGKNLRLYVDGQLAGEHDNMPELFNYDTATAAIAVNHWDVPSKGVVDELYIFDYALNSDEIAVLHQQLD